MSGTEWMVNAAREMNEKSIAYLMAKRPVAALLTVDEKTAIIAAHAPKVDDQAKKVGRLNKEIERNADYIVELQGQIGQVKLEYRLFRTMVEAHRSKAPKVDVGTRDVLNTLTNADNEATGAPYWLIVDPVQMMAPDIGYVASMITGPYFCREDAEHWLKNVRPHGYSDRAGVFCLSGNDAPKYKQLCESLRIGRSDTAHLEGGAS